MLLFLDDTRSPTVLIDLKFRQKWSHCRRSPHHSAFFIKCFCEILQYVTVRSDAILRTVILMWKCLFQWRNNWTNHKLKNKTSYAQKRDIFTPTVLIQFYGQVGTQQPKQYTLQKSLKTYSTINNFKLCCNFKVSCGPRQNFCSTQPPLDCQHRSSIVKEAPQVIVYCGLRDRISNCKEPKGASSGYHLNVLRLI